MLKCSLETVDRRKQLFQHRFKCERSELRPFALYARLGILQIRLRPRSKILHLRGFDLGGIELRRERRHLSLQILKLLLEYLQFQRNILTRRGLLCGSHTDIVAICLGKSYNELVCPSHHDAQAFLSENLHPSPPAVFRERHDLPQLRAAFGAQAEECPWSERGSRKRASRDGRGALGFETPCSDTGSS